MVKSYNFNSNKNGKKLLVFGAIHGDEICGPKAISNIIQKLSDKNLTLKNGEVTFIPVCNDKAYKQGKRYCDKNLNRVFQPQEHPSCYEEIVADELMACIKKADYLLDIHSMPSNGTPFVFQDYNDKESQDFATIQNLGYTLVGWPELFSKNGVVQDGSSCGYAKSVNTVSTTVECGVHDDTNATAIAEQCIINSLIHLDIINEKIPINIRQKTTFVKMQHVIYKETAGSLSKNWQHLDYVRKGSLIAEYESGEKIIAEYDGYIILPHKNPNMGDEWFYLGNKM